jgi:hypothetical protein
MALAGAATGAPAAPQAASEVTLTGTKLQATKMGTGLMAAVAPKAVEKNPYKAVLQSAAKASLLANSANRAVAKVAPVTRSLRAAPTALNQTAATTAEQSLSVAQQGSVLARTGVNAWQQETYGGYNLEPPDPTLCASPSFVVQVVNNQIQISDSNLNHLTAPIPNEAFFGDFTNFIFDPACTYNHSTGRWYYTLAVTDGLTFSGVYIAVSTSSDPRSPWFLYFMDVGNFGGAGACAAGLCLADQPLLGSDQYTLAISTNQFDISGLGNCLTGFCGAAYVLVDKVALALGLPFPNAVAYDISNSPAISPDFDFGDCIFAFGPCWYSIQPADSGNGRYDTRNGGTQWAMSALEFFGIGDNRIAVWQFRNTQTIGAFFPNITATMDVKHFPFGIYINPPDAAQPQNPTSPIQVNGNPLGDFLVLVGLCPPGTAPAGCSNPGRIQTEDDRMKDTVVTAQTNGHRIMWGGLTSDVGGRAGIHLFGVELGTTALNSTLVSHWILHNSAADVYFPAVASFDDGTAVVAYTVSASNLYASSGFSGFSTATAPSGIGIANLGHGVQDGFTQYPIVFGGRARWGDYSGAATALGRIYFTSEFIPDFNCSLAQFLVDDTCGPSAVVPGARKRTFFANWGTSLNAVGHP